MSLQASKQKTWPRIRKFMNDLHLWFGLISGIIVFLVCLSGTIYVFNTEIREWSQSEFYHISKGNKKIPTETLIENITAVSGGKVSSIKIPADPGRSYSFTVQMPPEESENSGAAGEKKAGPGGDQKGKESGPARGNSIQYLVNPYTGAVLGTNKDKNGVIEFMSYMFSLHRWLLLDKIEKPLIGELPNRKLGSYISGTATILFTLGVITGMIIWIPRRVSNWRRGLKIKWTASWKRVNHDLHNSLGFYSCILLFLMGITGPQWSFPWYREALRKTLGTYQAPDAPKPEEPGSDLSKFIPGKTLPLSAYLETAARETGYSGNQTITLPADSADIVTVSSTRTGFFAPAASDKVMLDQFDASVIKTDIFRKKPINERISGSIKAIHIGDVYGTFSKILYFLGCLIATSLPVTGTLIWLNKMKKR